MQSELKINMKELDAQAKASATNVVISTIKKQGRLEKIEQFKRKLARQKGSVEALLKSAMQQQLDGVRVGLNQLKSCQEEVQSIDKSMKEMFALFKNVPNLCNRLNDVREENMMHSQYVTAKENLKHIFTVPESVEKTKQWINDGKYLHAHQCLRDLENSRDDLLFELHKLPNQSPHDKSMLKAYFSDVETLSSLLEKQLRLILLRTLNTVRKEPTIIVTALRIIEREEKADEEALKQKKQTGFLAPGRPKKWKDMAFEVFEKAIATRVEGTQVQEREDNKNWLITYLELTRQMILEDLRVVKTLCVPCFPARYNIIDEYIGMYHKCLSRHLEEIIQNGLEGNEYVTVLAWTLNTYRNVDLLGHPDLIEHTKNLSPLLPKAVLDTLEGDYLQKMEANYVEWMRNTLSAEKNEWFSAFEPNLDHKTGAGPIIIFQMIDQNLQVAKTISEDLTNKALNLGIEEVIQYGFSYKDGIIEFKNRYFEDRKQIPYFTQHMITIVNNCYQLSEMGNQLEKQYWSSSSPSIIAENFKKLRTTFIQLRNDAGGFLLQELFLDLEKHFEELFNSRWLSNSLPGHTICLTLEDYFQDYRGLAENNFKFVVHQARRKVVEQYLTAMLCKRTSYKTYEECVMVSKKVMEESRDLRNLFINCCRDLEGDDPFETISILVEVLKSDDDMMSFELHRLVEKYPDIPDDHLLRFLHLRGDVPWSDVKDKVAHLTRPKISHNPSIFKNLVFPKLVNLFNN